MLLESEQWNTSVHPSRRQIPIALLMAVLAQLQGAPLTECISFRCTMWQLGRVGSGKV